MMHKSTHKSSFNLYINYKIFVKKGHTEPFNIDLHDNI